MVGKYEAEDDPPPRGIPVAAVVAADVAADVLVLVAVLVAVLVGVFRVGVVDPCPATDKRSSWNTTRGQQRPLALQVEGDDDDDDGLVIVQVFSSIIIILMILIM
jgi:hypothetical protein